MNGLVTYFYPDPIEGRTFDPLVFYFDKEPLVGAFYLTNPRLGIKVEILNDTSACDSYKVSQKIQEQLTKLYYLYLQHPLHTDEPIQVSTEIRRYFGGFPERPKENIPRKSTWL